VPRVIWWPATVCGRSPRPRSAHVSLPEMNGTNKSCRSRPLSVPPSWRHWTGRTTRPDLCACASTRMQGRPAARAAVEQSAMPTAGASIGTLHGLRYHRLDIAHFSCALIISLYRSAPIAVVGRPSGPRITTRLPSNLSPAERPKFRFFTGR
jgi:hypothetical protein